jgi:hypothetical protein
MHNWVSLPIVLLTTIRSICFVVLSLLVPVKTEAQTEAKTYTPKFSLTVGGAYAFQSINTMQQPSERGTSLRLDKFTTSPPLALRFQLNYAVNDHYEYRLLVSPFAQKGSFTASGKIVSESTEFATGETIETHFAFNSVRFGFANKITEGFFKNCKIGATLVVRKWEITLKSATKRSDNDNWLGLPLIYVGYEKNLTPKLNVTADLDALGFPSAYVMEGGGALNYKLSKHVMAGLQYRIISGAYYASDIANGFTSQNIGMALTAKF